MIRQGLEIRDILKLLELEHLHRVMYTRLHKNSHISGYTSLFKRF